MLVLGIETSCDETAAAVVEWKEEGRGKILSNIVRSQIEEHASYGGVVPEIAARSHVEILDKLIQEALKEAKISMDQVNAIAATAGPGLLGGLLVGLMTAKAIALAKNKPFIAVNHLEGHALTARLTSNICFPYLLLLISGGHTQTVLVRGVGDYERFGTTIDDALGETFDKTAKLLGLGWPGGPALEKAAKIGDSKRISLPCPLKGEKRLDFSFSGLKTAVRQAVMRLSPLNEQDVADICASFQATITEILLERVNHSMLYFYKIFPQMRMPVFVVAGGVAANKSVRSVLRHLCSCHGFRFVAPSAALCTDNAAMIAWAGAEHLAMGRRSFLDSAPRARWPLDENIAPKIGSGRKGAKA